MGIAKSGGGEQGSGLNTTPYHTYTMFPKRHEKLDHFDNYTTDVKIGETDQR